MQVKQIAIVAAIASSFAMPMTAKASDIATLNGWGALFAAAHSGHQASAQGQAQGEIKVSLFQRQQPPAAQPAPEASPEPAQTNLHPLLKPPKWNNLKQVIKPLRQMIAWVNLPKQVKTTLARPWRAPTQA